MLELAKQGRMLTAWLRSDVCELGRRNGFSVSCAATPRRGTAAAGMLQAKRAVGERPAGGAGCCITVGCRHCQLVRRCLGVLQCVRQVFPSIVLVHILRHSGASACKLECQHKLQRCEKQQPATHCARAAAARQSKQASFCCAGVSAHLPLLALAVLVVVKLACRPE